MNPHTDSVTHEIIGSAIDVHRHLGPGLLESAYRECLCHELRLRRKGIKLDCGYRVDVLVADLVVVELKAIQVIAAVHEAQLLTYLRLGGWKIGLLINFNVPVLKDGIRRRLL